MDVVKSVIAVLDGQLLTRHYRNDMRNIDAALLIKEDRIAWSCVGEVLLSRPHIHDYVAQQSLIRYQHVLLSRSPGVEDAKAAAANPHRGHYRRFSFEPDAAGHTCGCSGWVVRSWIGGWQ